MGFFDNDPFEDIVRNFFGGSGARAMRSSGGSGKAPLSKVTYDKKLFLVFDFSGEKDLKVDVKDQLMINDYGEEVYTGRKTLEIKSKEKVIGEYVLPDKVKLKGLDYTFKNGLLEVWFKK